KRREEPRVLERCLRTQHTSYRWSRVVEYSRLGFCSTFSRTKNVSEGSMGTLFMVNVPYNCSDEELTWWVESSGIEVKHVRVIRDTVSGDRKSTRLNSSHVSISY